MSVKSDSDVVDEANYAIDFRDEQKFKCYVCRKHFSSKHCLTEHKYKHTSAKPYKCLVCQVRFRHASQFSLHKKEHNVPQIFVWPRLEDLERINQASFELIRPAGEKIELPLILKPQPQELPLFESLRAQTFKKLDF